MGLQQGLLGIDESIADPSEHRVVLLEVRASGESG
jgi:hypothetical protein